MSFEIRREPIPFHTWWSENREDLKKEFGPPSDVETQLCEECNGNGELTCDLGHDHECEECDGKGKKTLSPEQALYAYAGDVYHARLARDRRKLEDYEKDKNHANS